MKLNTNHLLLSCFLLSNNNLLSLNQIIIQSKANYINLTYSVVDSLLKSLEAKIASNKKDKQVFNEEIDELFKTRTRWD